MVCIKKKKAVYGFQGYRRCRYPFSMDFSEEIFMCFLESFNNGVKPF